MQDFAGKVGYSRYSLYRGAGWLEQHLGHLVTVDRANGKATRIGLTRAGRHLFHPKDSNTGGLQA